MLGDITNYTTNNSYLPSDNNSPYGNKVGTVTTKSGNENTNHTKGKSRVNVEGMEVDKVIKAAFHGVDYIITVTVDESVLRVDIEEETMNGGWWSAEFSAKYIEEISHKTGNYKNFSVFVKMLCTALDGKSDSVYIDLLTYADLQLLRNRKSGASAPPTAKKESNNKRYLILTYAVEFDRVHYPLPLQFSAEPDSFVLRRTIQRLRQELSAAVEGGGDRDPLAPSNTSEDCNLLLEENGRLKAKMSRLVKEFTDYKTSVEGSKDSSEARLAKKIRSLETAVETERKSKEASEMKWRRKVEDLTVKVESLQREIKRNGSSTPSSRAGRTAASPVYGKFDSPAYERDRQARIKRQQAAASVSKTRPSSVPRSRDRSPSDRSRPSSIERSRATTSDRAKEGGRSRTSSPSSVSLSGSRTRGEGEREKERRTTAAAKYTPSSSRLNISNNSRTGNDSVISRASYSSDRNSIKNRGANSASSSPYTSSASKGGKQNSPATVSGPYSDSKDKARAPSPRWSKAGGSNVGAASSAPKPLAGAIRKPPPTTRRGVAVNGLSSHDSESEGDREGVNTVAKRAAVPPPIPNPDYSINPVLPSGNKPDPVNYDLSDLDKRLSALQTFLSNAKGEK